jgi:hypothetical protein
MPSSRSSTSQGSCTGTTLITCTLGTLDSGQSATVTLVVRPGAEGPFANTATVNAPSDPTPGNNSSTATPQVQAAPVVVAIPTMDAKTLMLFALILGSITAWMAGRMR